MDFHLKQRLVGAVVLVALGVIFIPMLLEGPDRLAVPDVEVMPEQQRLPHAGELRSFPAVDKVLPLPPVSVVSKKSPEPVTEEGSFRPVEKTAKPLPVPSPVSKKDEPKKTVSKPAKKTVAQKKTTSTIDTRKESLQSWVIQVGSFSSRDNAFRLRDKLRKAGYSTQVERVVLGRGVTYRVRVGPYLERAKADAGVASLNKKYQLQARVMVYPSTGSLVQ